MWLLILVFAFDRAYDHDRPVDRWRTMTVSYATEAECLASHLPWEGRLGNPPSDQPDGWDPKWGLLSGGCMPGDAESIAAVEAGGEFCWLVEEIRSQRVTNLFDCAQPPAIS